MQLGRVIGTVVCQTKDPGLEGIKLLMLQPVDEKERSIGRPLVACDIVQAGPGDLVLFEGGREAALALANWYNPSDATIMGIVDHAESEE